MTNDFRISMAAARVNAKLTQEEVCKALGISKATLCSWENGKSVPAVDRAEALANLYQCPMNRINFCRESSF